MLNVRLLLAGFALTLMSAYVVVNMHEDAEACSYSMSITVPEDNTIFYEGDLIDVQAEFTVPGEYFDPVEITAELQCTMTNRLEDTDTDLKFLDENGSSMSSHVLYAPTGEDPDVAQPFCIVVYYDIYVDRVNVTFIPWCCPCTCL